MTSWAALFARQPRAGQVKTRLLSVLEPQVAADLYAAFLCDTAATLAACCADHKIVAYTGEGAEESLPMMLSGLGAFDYRAQVDGSLGDRMQALFAASFDDGATATVLIGTDSPSMPRHLIDEALQRLKTHDIVLGPSTDGGYYLLGLSRLVPELFHGIDWGSGNVLTQTLAAAGDRSLSLLPVWYDVDLPAEAAFLRAHLQALRQAGQEVGEHSLAALEGLPLPPPS